MRPMQLSEIQAVGLEVLKHLDAFCREHHIQYWLSDGTLIGAVRHKGFIPWDDDIDVTMKRPDYDRFIREYVDSPKYKLFAPERHNSYLVYSRLCEMEQTCFKSYAQWTNENPGVGVDILPLDGCPDDYEKWVPFAKAIVENRKKMIRLRRLSRKPTFRTDLVGLLKDIVHFCVRALTMPIRVPLINYLLERDRKLRTCYPLGGGDHCTQILGVYDRRKFWRTEWFNEFKLTDFCDVRLPIPVMYDERLKAEYGDYMSLPPESERVGHDGIQQMWWRVSS